MEILILILLPLLAVAIVALRRWSRQPAPEQTSSFFGQRNFEGLFAEQRAEEARALVKADAELRAEEERAELLTRAYVGDEKALDDAYQTGNQDLYNEVLEALLAQANGDLEVLRSIAEYIVDSGGLRSTAGFSMMMIEHYQQNLTQRSIVDMLYLAALSDDASVYKCAVENAREHFKQGRIPRLKPRDFIATVESGYWLISAETRYSGSGFTLKRLIAEVRRELAAATRLSA